MINGNGAVKLKSQRLKILRAFLLFAFVGLVLLSLPAFADPVADARDAAESKYPELRDAQSIFALAYTSEESALRKSQPSIFNDENWPLILAFRVAEKLGKTGTSNESGKPNTSSVSDGRKAAEEGDPVAQRSLGDMYSTGAGVAKDPVEAAKWYRKAAEQGEVGAQVILGLLYEEGDGVAKDPVEAVKWYRKSAEQGLAIAQFSLGRMYSQGSGVTKDPVEAAKWLRKAAEQGKIEAEAQGMLGVLYFHGLGVAQDKAEGIKLIRKAEAAGSVEASAWLKKNADTSNTRSTSTISRSERSKMEYAIFNAGLSRSLYVARRMSDSELSSLYPQALQIIQQKNINNNINALRNSLNR